MAKTKTQKINQVKSGAEELKKNQTIILTDFTGLTANEMNALRKVIRSLGGVFRVIKKRLLKIVFEKEGIRLNPKEFNGQMGVVFSPRDMIETAGNVYNFAKQKKDFLKILGGFEVKEKKFIEGIDVKRIGQLPSREVLLGQVVGMLTAPIRKFLFVLNQKSRTQQ
ncbi:MAG: 50S ribosomal protein L10 [Patescibacteria group bacterium]|nr:50S ribosomal protein L10 [Patescibacteria group bacterium]